MPLLRLTCLLALVAFPALARDAGPWTNGTPRGPLGRFEAHVCAADTCLHVYCASVGAPLSFAVPGATGSTAEIRIDGGEPWPLRLEPGPDNLARATYDAAVHGGLIDALRRGRRMRLRVADTTTELTLKGSYRSLSRPAAACALPGTAVEARTAARPAGMAGAARPRRVFLPVLDPGRIAPARRAALEAVLGQTQARYHAATGRDLAALGLKLVETGPDSALLITRHCGDPAWFGPSGCVIDLWTREGDAWENAFGDETLARDGRIDLDIGEVRDGWPDVYLDGGAYLWRWNGFDYGRIGN